MPSKDFFKRAHILFGNAEANNIISEKGLWKFYDEDLDGYHYSFCEDPESIEKGELQAQLEEEFKLEKGEVVMVDLGGPGCKLAKSFSPSFLARSLGVIQESELKDGAQAGSNHEVLTDTNIFSIKAIQRLKKWLSQDKIHLLFERLYGGQDAYRADPDILYIIWSRYYKLLAEKAQAFIEIPNIHRFGQSGSIGQLITKWAERVNEEFADSLRLEMFGQLSGEGKADRRGSFRLHKYPGAPTELPKF